MTIKGAFKLRGLVAGGAAASLMLAAGAVRAADAPAASDDELAEVVITGTAIRGAAPVGANLITVGRQEIEESGAQTVQELLRSVPAVTGFGNAAQGGFGSADGAGTFAPTIHGLGASASNGTLVLVDGHRLPLTGINHTLADPNTIAPLAIERVEVLPEGASSTYGSDAVAGVINFITRRNYEGIEGAAQVAFADAYKTYSAGLLWGTKSEKTSVLLSYNYSFRSNLLVGDRAFTRADHTAQGGGNYANNNCAPATVTTTAGNFAYPYSGAAFTNSVCDTTQVADLLPENIRHNLLVKLTHAVNDNLTLSGDLVWSKQNTNSNISRGSVTSVRTWGTGSTVAGPGQINPFFTAPGGATTATVSWNADELFGRGAQNRAGADTFFVTAGAELKLGGDWQLNFGTTLGKDDSRQLTVGTLCSSCALLALNGTTNTGGSLTQPSVAGTTTTVLQSLTAANALDVWNPAATNRTSAAVRSQLLDSNTLQQGHQTLKDFTLKLDGTLAKLPGGNLRGAFGAEYLKYTMGEEQITARGTGPVSGNANTFFRDFDRDVQSFYGELLLPVFGEANGMPGLRRLDLDLSARYDKYNDFGSTTNPKFALSWGVTNGFTVRGNIGRSFTAPALTSRGDANGVTAESSFTTLQNASATSGTVTVPSSYPGITQLQALNLAGCTTGSATCLLGNSAVTGIQIAGGNKDLKPEKGKSFSVGFDFAPTAVPGLRLSATYWSAKYEGAITAPQASFVISSPTLGAQALTICPTGCSAAQIAAATSGLRQAAALPTNTFFILSFQQRNAFDLDAAGVDAEARYSWDTGLGKFNSGLSVSRKLKMDQKFGSDGVAFSVLNTVGINTTFPSNQTAGTFDFGWKRGAVNASVTVNYTGSYLNWGNQASTGNAAWAVVRQNGLYPVSGGQPIGAMTLVDLRAGYDFDQSRVKGLSLSLQVNNALDKDPNFFNVASGYDSFNANPIGRLITLGVKKKW